MARERLIDSRFGAQRNHAPNPRPAGASTGWSYSTGTGGTITQTLVATAGTGPQGRTGHARYAITAAPTAGTVGPYYRSGAGTLPGGLATDVITASIWVRPPVTARFRVSLGTRAGSAGVGSGLLGAYTTCPAGVWTRISVTGPAGSAYDELQVWAQLENPVAVIQVGQDWDAANVLVQYGTVLDPYFDGAMGNAKWDAAANASRSTGNGWAGRI